MPPFHHFTTKAKEAIRRAHELAIERGQNHVNPLHLLAALMLQEESIVISILEKLEVECLPTDLPERISVDISALQQIGNGIRVRDMVISENIRILNDEDEMIAVATSAKEEAADVVAAVPGSEAAAPEISVERGKKEDEAAEKK